MSEDLKYTCSVCGEPLARYGNKIMLDGVLCRNCAKNLSVFLTDEEVSRLATKDIIEHLKYRDDNKKAVKSFLATRKVEGKYSLLLDDTDDVFLFTKRKDIRRENPDVIRKKEVTSVAIREVPYRGNWENVDVLFEVELDSPNLNRISFPVNEFPGIGRDTPEYKGICEQAETYRHTLADFLAGSDEEMKNIKEEWYFEGGLNE